MEKLIDALNHFQEEVKVVKDDTELSTMFKNLAPNFLYGGYIQVNKDYKVFIRTVEFYFHSEEKLGIHDPIVYHRNGRNFEEVPYFPLMTLHAHNSGFDITFESETGKYRASALIRSYEVKDMIKKVFLKWDTGKCKFVDSDKYCYNTQSTYLYTLLNGFPLGKDNGILWVDSPRESKVVPGKSRQNVFLSESERQYKPIKGSRCKREWSFTREEQV